MEINQKNHNHAAACPYCVAAKNHKGGDKAFGPSSAKASAGREKLRAFLGVCGCLSCYIAMFPAILLGIVGIFGFSSAKTLDVLNAYMGSILFQPILIISILLLIVGLLRYGKMPVILSVFAGIGIFVSMNFFMQQWLFTLSFALVALGYFLAYRKTGSTPMKLGFALLILVVFIGILDIGQSLFLASQSKTNQPVNQMNLMR